MAISPEDLEAMRDNLIRLRGEGIRSASHGDKQTTWATPNQLRAETDLITEMIDGSSDATTAVFIDYTGWDIP